MLNKDSVRFIIHFARAYPVRTAIMVPLLIFAGLAEGFSLVTLFPILELATDAGATGPQSGPAQAVGGVLGFFGIEPTLAVLMIVVILGISLKSIFLWAGMMQAGYTEAHVAKDLRLRLIDALLSARWSYFTSEPAGHFATATSIEARRASTAYRQACSLMAGLIQVAVYVGIVFLVSWKIAVLAVIAGAAIALLLGRFVDISRAAGRHTTFLMRSLVGTMTDALHGIKPIKAMAQEKHVSPLLERETQGIRDAHVRHVFATQSLIAMQEPIVAVMLAGGLYLAIKAFSVNFSSLLVLAFLFYRLIGRVNKSQAQYQTMAVGESAFYALKGMTDTAVAERERNLGTREPTPVVDAVRLDSVDFAYGEKEVLNKVSLEIQSGQFVTLVGPSGAGKTTIADLIVGLQRPDNGSVLIDSVSLSDIDMVKWRHMIGYVPQEMFLFHDSVFENVTVGDKEITREQVESALKAAGAWDFVSQLTDGMDTPIGEAGSKLSGGQRQRVAIARALVRKPALLVLDEVTTALDPKTESAISKTLANLRGIATILAISHQPAMIEVADVVYRVEGGHVTALEPDGYHAASLTA